LLGSIGCTLNTSGKSSFLDRATSLTGTKTTTSNTSLKGKVIDALDEKGLNNLTVTTEGNLITKTANDGVNDGIFQFTNVPSSKTKAISFILSVGGSGYETAYRTMTINTSDYGKTVDSSESSRGGPIKIYRTTYAQIGYVIGQVLNHEGEPLDGITVETLELNTSTTSPYRTYTTSSGMPKKGMFRLELPAAPPDNQATYTIVVKAVGYNNYTASNVVIERLQTKDLGQLKLSETTSSAETRDIVGQVVDADTLLGVDGVTVRTEGGLSVLSGNITPKVNQGDFIIEDAPVGTYYIFASGTGWMEYKKQVTVAVGAGSYDAGSFPLSKGPAETVYGKVYDANTFVEIQAATVEIRNYDFTFFKSTLTATSSNEDGIFRFDQNIPIDNSNDYVMTAKSQSYISKSTTISITDSDSIDINTISFPLVKIASSVWIYGEVKETDNVTVISFATVEAYDKLGVPSGITAETDGDGIYVLQGITPGYVPYTLKVTKVGYQQGVKTVTYLETGGNEIPPILLEKLQGEIYGIVYISDGDSDDGTDYSGITRVISDATVTLINKLSGVSTVVQSRIDGSYIFTNVDQGNYIIAGEKPGAYDLHFYQVAITPTSYRIEQDIELPTTSGGAGDGFLTGIVKSAINDKPIPNATVKLVGTPVGVGEATTNDAGRFSFGYNPGEYVGYGFSQNYSYDYRDSIILEEGKVTSITFELQPIRGTLAGQVLSGSNLVGGATVELWNLSESTREAGPDFTDNNDGRYKFYEVQYGNYYLIVSADGFYTSKNRITIDETIETMNVNLSRKSGNITGVVYHDINKDGAYTANEEFEGARIDIEGTNYVAFTAPNGIYNITGVSVALYNVVASYNGYQDFTREVDILSGSTVTVNFQLDKSGGSIAGIVYYDINDSSSYDTGEGLEGATVELWKDGSIAGTFQTLSGGSYEFSPMDAGTYIIKAGKDTYSNNSMFVTIANATTFQNLDLTPMFGTVVGVVKEDADEDGVADAGESPLSGVTVLLTSFAGEYSVTYTDATGNFTFENIAKGAKTLTADAGDYYTTVVKNAQINAGEPTTVDFALINNKGRISGTVTDSSDSTPLEGVSVTLLTLAGVTETYTYSNTSGTYWLIGITRGTYKLFYEKQDYTSNNITFDIIAGQSVQLSTISLSPTMGSLSGEVRDIRTGLPISGSVVLLSLNNNVVSTSTDAGGGFRFSQIAAGIYEVGAHNSTFHSPMTKEVEVEQAKTSSVLLELYPLTGGISGEVVNAFDTSQKLSGATVECDAGIFYTNSIGALSITGLTEGNKKLIVNNLPLYESKIYYVDVTAGQTTGNNVFELNPLYGAMSGEVYSTVGNLPISGASITVYSQEFFTDNSGRFSITGLTAGSKMLTARKPEYKDSIVYANIEAGKTTLLSRIYLNTIYGALSGEVIDSRTEEKISGASISFAETGHIATTDSLGTFSITGITEGTKMLLIGQSPEYDGITKFAITITAGQIYHSIFRLTRALGEITGEIKDAFSGAKLVGASVTSEGKTVYTDSLGYYSITGISEGTHLVTANNYPDYVSRSINITISKGQISTGNDFYLSQKLGTELSGEVQDSIENTAISGVTVTIDGRPISEAIFTDSDGNFTFRDITPELLLLKFSKDGYNDASKEVYLTSGQKYKLPNPVKMIALKPVYGTIKHFDTNDTLEGITVECEGIQSFSGSDGSYLISGITFGTHTVYARGGPIYSDSSRTFSMTSQDVTGKSGQDMDLKKQLLSLSGEITDLDSGLAIAGATITINALPATADEYGMFGITGISVGTHTVKIEYAPDYAQTDFFVTFVENTDIESRQFRLSKSSSTVKGIIFDKYTSTPLSGATVSIYPSTPPGVVFENSVTTALDGTFTLTGVTKGYKDIYARYKGEYRENFVTVNVEEGQTISGISIPIVPIYYYYISGTVYDHEGNVFNQARVWTTVAKTVRVKTDGTYTLTGLSTGLHTFTCETVYTTGGTYDNYTKPMVTINILEDPSKQHASTIDFTLTPKFGKIDGTVIKSGGSPFSGVSIMINDVDATISLFDGTYNVEDLTPETYKITAYKADYLTVETYAEVKRGTTFTADFNMIPNITSITGTVTYKNGAAYDPVIGASVSLDSPALDTISESDGLYQFLSITPGNKNLIFSAEGYAVERRFLNVLTGEAKILDIILTVNIGNIYGVISDKTGNPIEGASVTYASKVVYTEDTGSYFISGITEGIKTISIRHDTGGYIQKSVSIDVIAGETVTKNATLERLYGTLYGTITDDDTTAALSGATLRVSSIYNGNIGIETTVTDVNGRYIFDAITAEFTTVEIFYYPKYTSKSHKLTITGGLSTENNVSLVPGLGTVFGTVYDIDTLTSISVELSGVTVQIVLSGSTISKQLTDVYGAYEFKDLQPGFYTVYGYYAGYNHDEKSINVLAGISHSLNLFLYDNIGSVEGLVQNSRGSILAGAYVYLFTSESSYIANLFTQESTVSDATGAFSFNKVTAGTYFIVAEKESYIEYNNQSSYIIQLDRDEAVTTPNILLSGQYGTIAGTIVGVKNPFTFNPAAPDPTNFDPLSGVTYWYAQQGSAIDYGTPYFALNYGSFEIVDLSAGAYNVVSKHNYYDTGEAFIEVIAGENNSGQYIFNNNLYGSVAGQVLEGTGFGATVLSGATVILRSVDVADVVIRTVHADSNGIFVINNVLTNNYADAGNGAYQGNYIIEAG
ncbi:carboxypeptidase regulatory-like domain-containing protein, partial [bacterium]|nr:carboxypeptidase regulatory-like domain-containing protein [bacterium]